ncbi:MAG: sodium/solute symporter [Phycisphaeraceae bacterium]
MRNTLLTTPLPLLRRVIVAVLASVLTLMVVPDLARGQDAGDDPSYLDWISMPEVPDGIGVAGPYVGLSNNGLIVAGGANFPVAAGEDLWDVPKVWHREVWVLKNALSEGEASTWAGPYELDRALGYGASVTTPYGVLCIGGNDGDEVFSDVFLLVWDPDSESITQLPLPSLPEPLVYASAVLVGETIYLAGGQTGSGLGSASKGFWRLDLSSYASDPSSLHWEALPSWPGPARAFNMVSAQHNGFDTCVYVLGGRRVSESGEVEVLSDVYEFNPTQYDSEAYDEVTGTYSGTDRYAEPWRSRADMPEPRMAGTAVAWGQSHVFLLSGDDGALFGRADELKDDHPGFPRRALAYHTITDTWVDAGPIPANQVTTHAVKVDGSVLIASGEVRPRVRSTAVWRVEPVESSSSFGVINFTVLAVYLASMLGVGFYFMNRNKNTDDYFRGGQRIPWWAAACSIFATMLSSITFMAIPAKAYAQDWVYFAGNMMIPVVAPIAIYVALPFFRSIDATSAYEYLEKRFNRVVRMFASGLFLMFHVFRMAIVMSLAGLALASVTPMSPVECVLIMGVLSVAYSTMGGVEAVIWTDTIQTVVLLGGALFCVAFAIWGVDGGLGGTLDHAFAHDKLQLANWHIDPTSASIALWVIILGGIGQNISSYTADQAVVQRYMTTPDIRRAAASIWMAALLAIPASLLFYGLGTALFAFYRDHPEKLDPMYMTDQILPLFIVEEVPVGIAGLIVAGIFAAAQSTISTSMNSTATAATVDFYRPLGLVRTEKGALNLARITTLALGTAGTLLAIMFVQPDVKSLFDEFIRVIGLFMGVLGGLFALGVLTTRCSAAGALIGVVGGAAVMFALPVYTEINGYLYATIGITTCFILGYLVSLLTPKPTDDKLAGLTVHTSNFHASRDTMPSSESALTKES